MTRQMYIGGDIIEYRTDEKWKEAKDLARIYGEENNWIEVVSFYEELGGEHVQVYCSLEQGDKRRIVSPIDDQELVLTIARGGEVVVDDYEEVLHSKKIFIYAEHSKETKVDVPEPYSILGEKQVIIFK